MTDIHDFRAEHFELADYHPNPAIGDPMPGGAHLNERRGAAMSRIRQHSAGSE